MTELKPGDVVAVRTTWMKRREALAEMASHLDAPMVEAVEFHWCAYCRKSDPASLADHEPDCEWRLLREAAL